MNFLLHYLIIVRFLKVHLDQLFLLKIVCNFPSQSAHSLNELMNGQSLSHITYVDQVTNFVIVRWKVGFPVDNQFPQ